MSRYSIFKRGKIYYAQIKNPETGKYFPAKSTGKVDESEALLVVSDWLHNGLPEKTNLQQSIDINTIYYALRTVQLNSDEINKISDLMVARGFIESVVPVSDGADAELITSFLKNFWDYDTSPYVKEKLAYGESIGKRYCIEMGLKVKYFTNYFGEELRLKDLTRAKLEEFQFHLKGKGLSARFVNIIMNTITIPVRWAHLKGTLRVNPVDGLRRFSGRPKQRGILTPKEVEKVFKVKWKDDRTRVANLVAMTTGLRQGEILALKLSDIKKDRILVRHAWSYPDGLKSPKNGEERVVPLLPMVREELLKLIEKSPWGKSGFIFYSTIKDQPFDGKQLLRGLKNALIDMTITENDKEDT